MKKNQKTFVFVGIVAALALVGVWLGKGSLLQGATKFRFSAPTFSVTVYEPGGAVNEYASRAYVNMYLVENIGGSYQGILHSQERTGRSAQPAQFEVLKNRTVNFVAFIDGQSAREARSWTFTESPLSVGPGGRLCRVSQRSECLSGIVLHAADEGEQEVVEEEESFTVQMETREARPDFGDLAQRLDDTDESDLSCFTFEPRTAMVYQNSLGKYVVRAGNVTLNRFKDFDEAYQASEVIRQFGFEEKCTLHANGETEGMQFWFLPGRQAPTRSSHPLGEDCIEFNPDRLRIVSENSQFVIQDRAHELLASPNRETAERQVEMIQQYGFNRMCFVDRPNPSMHYFRKH